MQLTETDQMAEGGKKILLIDFTNFEDYPIGGYLSFARNMMASFNGDLALIGIVTTQNDPVGKWFRKEIKGDIYDFFAIARYAKTRTKHTIPDRLVCFFLLRYYKSRILKPGFKNLFIQRQEILPAIRNFGFRNICYRFPGLENPLQISKYWFGRYLAKAFEKMFFNSIGNVDLILASGDEAAINDMINRSGGKVSRRSVIKFPTRINTDIYKPGNKEDARRILKIPAGKTVVITTGRLTALKGWKFMIDCFSVFEKNVPDSIFYFIGEGEDRKPIMNYITSIGLENKIVLAGHRDPAEISLFLQAADLFIMGSYMEGWPTSLVEAAGCGVPVCVTDFSGAREIVTDGINGYVTDDHNKEKFAGNMLDALKLETGNVDISRYSLSALREDLLHYWSLI